MSDLISRIKEKAAELAATRNQELVDVEIQSTGAVKTLKIIVGSQAGPMVADLSSINKAFREYCSTHAELKAVDDFVVEVCSPGLERPLTTPADYRRNLNRFIKIQYSENEKIVKKEFRLNAVTGDELQGVDDAGKPFTIKISAVKKAQPAIRF